MRLEKLFESIRARISDSSIVEFGAYHANGALLSLVYYGFIGLAGSGLDPDHDAFKLVLIVVLALVLTRPPAFVVNRQVVFQATKEPWQVQARKFLIVTIGLMVANWLVLPIFVSLVDSYPIFPDASNALFATLLPGLVLGMVNWSLNKFWIFGSLFEVDFSLDPLKK